MVVDKEFGQRLRQACDDVPQLVPPKSQGRLAVIAKACDVSGESVSRWLSGENRPRVKSMKKLADFLQCDAAWLSLGTVPNLKRSEYRTMARATRAASHIALGLAMMEGTIVATPDDKDPRRDLVDFYLWNEGRQQAIRATTGMPAESKRGEYDFYLPREYEQVRNIGFLKDGIGVLTMLDLQADIIAKHYEIKKGEVCVTVRKGKLDAFFTGRDQLTTLLDFKSIW